MPEIGLRAVHADDLDTIFDQMRDPVAVRMAAFTADDPDDRAEFDAHQHRLDTWPGLVRRAITVDGELAGTAAVFAIDGDTEITYWLARRWWGRGIATEAVRMLLREVPVRPVIARAASDNAGSLAVLRKAGFRVTGTGVHYANARGEKIEETVLTLE
ncbi:GNAT family N-acetyltransferase [Actinoplanes sp. NPDC051494]|uniref:GNAT family N-acetyltransferase n=1 Tax=Actinoplanes sp. NPDC051494 TaxID=3363907 RepID=UPI0037AC7EF3